MPSINLDAYTSRAVIITHDALISKTNSGSQESRPYNVTEWMPSEN